MPPVAGSRVAQVFFIISQSEVQCRQAWFCFLVLNSSGPCEQSFPTFKARAIYEWSNDSADMSNSHDEENRYQPWTFDNDTLYTAVKSWCENQTEAEQK